ncbi:MAG: glycosyltransferase [Candidatus Altiarchaeota archaeon]
MDSVSVVIPTINEAENIKELIPRVERIFDAAGLHGEVIVVDDLSTDGTPELARKMNSVYGNVKVLAREVRNGLGNALREGVGVASNELVVFMDADLSHDPKEIANFVNSLKEHDVVVGSRFMSGGNLKRGTTRNVISGTYNIVSRALISVKVADITSGYRGFHKKTFESLNLKSTGPEIHSELVVKATIEGYRIGEIPISYVDRRQGKSKLNYMNIGPGYSRVLALGFLSRVAKILRLR